MDKPSSRSKRLYMDDETSSVYSIDSSCSCSSAYSVLSTSTVTSSVVELLKKNARERKRTSDLGDEFSDFRKSLRHQDEERPRHKHHHHRRHHHRRHGTKNTLPTQMMEPIPEAIPKKKNHYHIHLKKSKKHFFD